MNELTTLTVTNPAADSDLPPQTLTYTVTAVVDTNAMIANGWPLGYATGNPPPTVNSSGVISWTPDEAQGPGVYFINTVVTDNGAPPLSATNSFIVTVNEVNTPPVLPSQPNYIINMLTPLVVINTAADSDLPPNPLTYQLSGPTGATIDTNGIISWTPTLAQGGTTNVFTTVVTDTNAYALVNQSLSATNSFTVVVTTLINLPGSHPQTNTAAAGSIAYYVVNVPASADFATNILLYATGPLRHLVRHQQSTNDQHSVVAQRRLSDRNERFRRVERQHNAAAGARFHVLSRRAKHGHRRRGLRNRGGFPPVVRAFHRRHHQFVRHRHQHRRDQRLHGSVAGADEFPIRDPVDDQSRPAGMAHGPEPGHQPGRDADQRTFQLV